MTEDQRLQHLKLIKSSKMRLVHQYLGIDSWLGIKIARRDDNYVQGVLDDAKLAFASCRVYGQSPITDLITICEAYLENWSPKIVCSVCEERGHH